MDIRTYLLLAIILLCISIINNVVMYYKCYNNNDIADPFIPENVGVYKINIYYNKYQKQDIENEIKTYIDPFKDKMINRYVVTYNKPKHIEYQQISKLGNFQN